ncbi:MAG: S41 family peptidase [Candidatus Eremiobacteraeota bacterium]|nr:S41 family peptidase [Candidatus Eremiobacteraeota bacterium]
MLPARAADVTLLDLIEVEIGHSSIAEQYYRPLATQGLLDGARTGMLSYLKRRGVPSPQIAIMHAQANGRGAVPAIEKQIGIAIQRYGARVEPRALVYAAIRGELASLRDPYSVFFTSAELKKFSAAVDGETFGGVGLVVTRDSSGAVWRIAEVFENGPAARQGVLAGDVLAHIDGSPAGALTNDALVARLRGKPGSHVHLGLLRSTLSGGAVADPKTVDVDVVRRSITEPNVRARLLPGGVAYVALRSFDADAGKTVRAAVEKLDAQGATALVLDLRDNGGGYERASVAVVSNFIAGGPVVTIEQRRGKRVTETTRGKPLAARPVAVLVNGNSASGAELVAAALQERGVAKVVGTTTFGKGLVQTMIPLPDGSALKLTTARYLTSSGRDLDHRGVVPDVTVAEPAGSTPGVPGSDPQLDRALELLQGASVGAQKSPLPS